MVEPTGVQVVEEEKKTEVRGVVHSRDLMAVLGSRNRK